MVVPASVPPFVPVNNGVSPSSHAHFPPDVGIRAMDIYFPRRCIDQVELEKHDGVAAGKYTVGLGQLQMAYVDDQEDINSICLTVVRNLMDKYNISYLDIGRLEVGTETMIDKSKSVKTHLMDLFATHGNTAIEGIATTNACYGGTAALFNAVQWIESSYWDGRLAIVVAADIAIYSSGNARPTSGAGAVAMLVGPGAPLVMDRGLRGTHMENVYDFYKPNLSSEFPEVDGALSVACYMRAIDKCYHQYMAARAAHPDPSSPPSSNTITTTTPGSLSSPGPLLATTDFAVFHSPYAKIVQKAAARLFLNDYVRHPTHPMFADVPPALASTPLESSYVDKDVEKTFVALSHPVYAARTEPSLLTCKLIGNMYCASLYGSLISLLSVTPEADLLGKRILMFSYGSGLASSMFSLRVAGPVSSLVTTMDVQARLQARTVESPARFEDAMTLRHQHHNAANYTPGSHDRDSSSLWPGTYHLVAIDAKLRRTYARTPLDGALHPPAVPSL